MASVSIHSDFGAQQNKVCYCFCHFPIYFPWSDGTGCHNLSFFECWLLLSFKSAFSLSSFTFIKRLFSSSLLSVIRVVSCAYLRLWIFLSAILIPACASSSLAFHMMYSAYKLTKQDDNIQPWHTPFPIWIQSIVPCLVLTVASWPAYRFLRRQVRWSGYSHLFRREKHLFLPHWLHWNFWLCGSQKTVETHGKLLKKTALEPKKNWSWIPCGINNSPTGLKGSSDNTNTNQSSLCLEHASLITQQGIPLPLWQLSCWNHLLSQVAVSLFLHFSPVFPSLQIIDGCSSLSSGPRWISCKDPIPRNHGT